jgi:hypothetical protein
MHERFTYAVKLGRSYTIFRFTVLIVSIVGGAFALKAPPVLRIATVVIAAAMITLVVRTFFYRSVAFGVTRDGIVVSDDALLHPNRALSVRWEELESIILWRNKIPLRAGRLEIVKFSVISVCLELRPFAVSKYSSTLRFRDSSRGHSPVANFRGLVIPTGGTAFDYSRFVESVNCDAPEVRIIDILR